MLGDFSQGNYSALSSIKSGTYSKSGNDWTGTKTVDTSDNTSPANTNILLNEFFYNKISTSDSYGECINWTFHNNNNIHKTFSCSDIVGRGLDNIYRNYVQKATWHLRGYDGNAYSKQEFYLCERGQTTATNCMSGNSNTYDSTTTENIGLMYVSDYMYASSDINDTYTLRKGNAYENGRNNWLYKGLEWTITLDSNDSSNAIYVTSDGSVASSVTYISRSIRPTFYLKSSVYVTGGDGSFDNPYTIACDDCG